jgi:hypothetical protein
VISSGRPLTIPADERLTIVAGRSAALLLQITATLFRFDATFF